MICGFSASPILSLLEVKGTNLIFGFLEKRTGISMDVPAKPQEKIIVDPNNTPTYAPQENDGAPKNRFDN